MAVPAKVALTPSQSVPMGSTHFTIFHESSYSLPNDVYLLVSLFSASALPLDRKTHERETFFYLLSPQHLGQYMDHGSTE